MTPNIKASSQKPVGNNSQYEKLQIVWRIVIYFSVLHIAALYGIYLIFSSAKIWTALWGKSINIKLIFPQY